MEHSDVNEEKRVELVRVAKAMISGECDLIEGVRKLTALRFATDRPNDPIFDAIRGLESETDHLPVGAERALWAPVALAEKDALLKRYIETEGPQVLDACSQIVRAFDTSSSLGPDP
jgi:hypothetical protein